TTAFSGLHDDLLLSRCFDNAGSRAKAQSGPAYGYRDEEVVFADFFREGVFGAQGVRQISTIRLMDCRVPPHDHVACPHATRTAPCRVPPHDTRSTILL